MSEFHSGVLRDQIRAAELFGRLCARGLMSSEEAIQALTSAAAKRAPQHDPGGLRCRMAWALGDAIRAWSRRRDNATYWIGRVIAPLIAGRAPGADILAAAATENAKHGNALTPAEVLSDCRSAARASMVKRRGRR